MPQVCVHSTSHNACMLTQYYDITWQSNHNKVAACALHLVHVSVDVSYLQRECCVRILYVVILNSMYYIKLCRGVYTCPIYTSAN